MLPGTQTPADVEEVTQRHPERTALHVATEVQQVQDRVRPSPPHPDGVGHLDDVVHALVPERDALGTDRGVGDVLTVVGEDEVHRRVVVVAEGVVVEEQSLGRLSRQLRQIGQPHPAVGAGWPHDAGGLGDVGLLAELALVHLPADLEGRPAGQCAPVRVGDQAERLRGHDQVLAAVLGADPVAIRPDPGHVVLDRDLVGRPHDLHEAGPLILVRLVVPAGPRTDRGHPLPVGNGDLTGQGRILRGIENANLQTNTSIAMMCISAKPSPSCRYASCTREGVLTPWIVPEGRPLKNE